MEEKASKAFDCETCNESLQRSRNCKGMFPAKEGKKGFLFAIGTVKFDYEVEEKTINECPIGFITDFSRLLWAKYQEVKVKKELGIMSKVDELKKIHFEAFKVFMQTESEHFEMRCDKDKPKGNKK